MKPEDELEQLSGDEEGEGDESSNSGSSEEGEESDWVVEARAAEWALYLGEPSSPIQTPKSPNLSDSSSRTQSTFNRVAISKGDKAGMTGFDEKSANSTVFELIQGSKYYENEKRKDTKVDKRIEALRSKLEALKSSGKDIDFWLTNDMKAVLASVQQQDEMRKLDRIVLHIDMDAFYASVEVRDNPSLRGKPVAVGDMAMVATSSYEARKFGVRAGLPGFIAAKLCPELIFVPKNMAKYKEASALVGAVFAQYDPYYQPLSLDEASLDITDYLSSHPGVDVKAVIREIREKVARTTQLTFSVGVACNKLLAKICSNINKPAGEYFLPPRRDAILEFMRSLPLRKVPGIGPVSERILNSLGFTTCGELCDQRATIFFLFSSVTAKFLVSAALGLDVEKKSRGNSKSASKEKTFSPTSSEHELLQKLEEVAEQLAQEMRQRATEAKVLTLKWKTTKFSTKTKARQLPRYISSFEEIYKEARALLMRELPLELRLLGIRLSEVRPNVRSPTASVQPRSQPQRTLEELFTSQLRLEATPTLLPISPQRNQVQSVTASPIHFDSPRPGTVQPTLERFFARTKPHK